MAFGSVDLGQRFVGDLAYDIAAEAPPAYPRQLQQPSGIDSIKCFTIKGLP